MTMQGKILPLDVKPTDKVLTVKREVQTRIPIDIEHVVFNYNGMPLNNNSTIEDYGIKDGDTVHIVISLIG